MTTFNDLPEDLHSKIYEYMGIESKAFFMMSNIYNNVNFWEKDDDSISNYFNNNKELFYKMGSKEDIITKFKHWYIHNSNSPDRDEVIINTKNKKFILIRSKYNKQIFHIGDTCITWQNPKTQPFLFKKNMFKTIQDFIISIDNIDIYAQNSTGLTVNQFVKLNKNDNYYL